ncbi:MAG: hypothetical protein HOP19_29610 [Acidobacteria bacterium]|nr:hypothetical protein [Acidobacteriota bacterium]
MNWLRRQLNEILGLFFLSFGLTPTDAMKEQLGIAARKEAEAEPVEEEKDADEK